MLDESTEFGARVTRRLGEEHLIWLTTVRADGRPVPTLVWFLWENNTFLIYSQGDKPKLRNIEHNPKVALNFNSDQHGGDMVIFNGEAQIVTDVPPAHEHAVYLEKYRDDIAAIGMTPDLSAKEYSVVVRVVPKVLRGH